MKRALPKFDVTTTSTSEEKHYDLGDFPQLIKDLRQAREKIDQLKEENKDLKEQVDDLTEENDGLQEKCTSQLRIISNLSQATTNTAAAARYNRPSTSSSTNEAKRLSPNELTK